MARVSCLRRASAVPPTSRGDVGPLAALAAQVGQLPLLVGEPVAEGGEQLAALDDLAGRGRAGGEVDRLEAGGAAVVAALGAAAGGWRRRPCCASC